MVGVLLQVLPSLVNLGRDLVDARRQRHGSDEHADWARYAPGTGPIAPLPIGWERWLGARPEPRGAPSNTVLNVRGLATMTPRFRAQFVDLCDELGIPVDSLAAVIANESEGYNPRAYNPLPAAGLIQLTVGANLDGFSTKEAIQSVVGMSAEEQIDRVIRPYYARMHAARSASPGHLYMLNFLPDDAGQPEDFQLGIKGASGWRGKVYEVNAGFDVQKKGYFTVGDVYAVAASICRGAKGRRITVDGRILEPPFDGDKGAAVAAASPQPGQAQRSGVA